MNNHEVKEIVSAVVPDWSRERLKFLEWDPGKRLLMSIRAYQYWRSLGLIGILMRYWSLAQFRIWSVISGADIPLTCCIDGGLLLPHPNGVVVHPEARIGPNCLVFQQVTIGAVEVGGVPVIGGHVDIGAGAKLLGPIVVGDHVVIGANAVVVHDVPSNHVAVGIPAKCYPRRR